MPYYLIPMVGSIGLTAAFVFVTDARVWAKALATILLAASFAWRYGMFLQVGLSVCLLLYFACLKART